jgi:hypothetical protein
MPQYDSDYFRARAIEERGAAREADSAGRADVAAIHRELADKLDGLAAQREPVDEQFETLAAQASRLIKNLPG